MKVWPVAGSSYAVMQVPTGISVTGWYDSKNGSTEHVFTASPSMTKPEPRQVVSAWESSSARPSFEKDFEDDVFRSTFSSAVIVLMDDIFSRVTFEI